MTEEVKTEVTEVVEQTQESQTVTEPQLSEVEQQAYKEGWRTKEEYSQDSTKDPSRWIPADEFMRRKPLFEKIDSLKQESYQSRKELQEVKKALNDLSDHHKKVRDNEYKRALDELKAQRRVAIEDSNIQVVEAIEERMDSLKEEKQEFDAQLKQEQQTQTKAGPTAEYVEWVKDNSWYNTNKEMHDFADSLGVSYLQSNPNATPNDVFSYVTKQTKRAYPDSFPEARKSRPSAVDSSTPEPRTSKKDDLSLSPAEEEVARRFERRGIMTRAEYAKQLKKLK